MKRLSSAPQPQRSSGLGRGCATLAIILLIIQGGSTIFLVILPPSASVRENAGTYLAIGLALLLTAGAVWRLWLRPARPSHVQPVRLQEPGSHGALKQGVKYVEDILLPSQSSTDLLQWAWLIRLDLAFRQHLWVRIAALLASILVLFLVVPVVLALLYNVR